MLRKQRLTVHSVGENDVVEGRFSNAETALVILKLISLYSSIATGEQNLRGVLEQSCLR
jgi:hypothetical protein